MTERRFRDMSHFRLWNRCVALAPLRRTGEFPKPNVRVMISCIERAADWTFGAPTISFPFSLLGQALAPGSSVSEGPHLRADDRVKDAAASAASAGAGEGGSRGREPGSTEACGFDARCPPCNLQTP